MQVNVDAGDCDAARKGLLQPGQAPHQGRLAGAVGPDQGGDSALAYGHADTVQGAVGRVLEDQVFDSDKGIGHRST